MSDKMSDEKVALLRVVRRRGRRVPDRGAARGSALVLLDRRTARARDAGRVPSRPVLERRPTRSRTSRRPAPRSGSQTDGPRHALRRRASAPAARSPASARYLKAQNPDVQIVGADPSGSVYSGGTGRPYLIEGVGEDFWPTTFDPSLVDRVVEVSDADAFLTARRVTREEGLLIGGSGGTAVHAALEVARPLGADASSSCCCPTPAAATCRRSSTTSGCSTWASCAAEGPVAGDVLAAKGHATARSRARSLPEEPVRDAITRDARDRRVAARRQRHEGAAARGQGGRRARCASSS